MTGQTGDVSQLGEDELCERVKFHNSSVARFPDNRMLLGRHQGQSTDIGLTVTAKTLKANGNTERMITNFPLTEKESIDEDETQNRKQFAASVFAQ